MAGNGLLATGMPTEASIQAGPTPPDLELSTKATGHDPMPSVESEAGDSPTLVLAAARLVSEPSSEAKGKQPMKSKPKPRNAPVCNWIPLGMEKAKIVASAVMQPVDLGAIQPPVPGQKPHKEMWTNGIQLVHGANLRPAETLLGKDNRSANPLSKCARNKPSLLKGTSRTTVRTGPRHSRLLPLRRIFRPRVSCIQTPG